MQNKIYIINKISSIFKMSFKLKLKSDYLQQEQLINTYQENDSKEYPAWTFLISKIIDLYGICPYLSPTIDLKSRSEWLHSQKDAGKLIFF